MSSNHNVQEWLNKNTSVDETLLYLARKCKIHPHLYDCLLTQLEEMENRGKLCLIPISIFQIYHKKLRKTA